MVSKQITDLKSNFKRFFEDGVRKKGGPGSGHFGHAGRPGEVGGSAPRDVGTITGYHREMDNRIDNLSDPLNNPNFRVWFEGSKVLDEQGKPLVVYRGDASGKHVFDRSTQSGIMKGNYFFVDSPSVARFYTKYWGNSHIDYGEMTENNGFYRAYLSMKKPLIIDPGEDGCGWASVPLSYWLMKKLNWQQDYIGIDDLAYRANKAGYDGIIVKNVDDEGGRGTQYVVFNSEQIKSIFNQGTFDPNDPDIHKEISTKGGPGSGHFGHAGRPGEVGGSAPKSGMRSGTGSGAGSDPMDNPNFRTWFDGSKVVDENGNPKIMYHGTDKDFTEFQYDIYEMGPSGKTSHAMFGPGFYFTENPEIASEYTLDSGLRNTFTEGANVKPVYLSIKKPFDMGAVFSEKKAIAIARKLTGNRDADKYVEFEKIDGNITGESIYRGLVDYFSRSTMFVMDSGVGKSKLWSALMKNGYDGITHEGGGRYYKNDPRRHMVFIAFYPEQIKSAFNEGTFDPNDPDIHKEISTKGGPGSGHFGHAGRPGEVGGSAPKDSAAAGTDESGSAKRPMDNPNFRRWFGRSKVVDKDGNPLVAYHGTPSHGQFSNNRYVVEEQYGVAYPVIQAFNPEYFGITDSGWLGKGMYFTPDAEYAYEFGNIIMPVYIKSENPFIIIDDGSNGYENSFRFRESLDGIDGVPDEFKLNLEMPKKEMIIDHRGDLGYYHYWIDEGKDDNGNPLYWLVSSFVKDGEKPNEKKGGIIESSGRSKKMALAKYNDKIKNFNANRFISQWIGLMGSSNFSKILQDAGYDGVFSYTYFGGEKSEHPSEILVYEPEQIKSIFNEGTFDPDDPRILKEITRKGGPGSGHFDHAGRPGEVGGSAPKDSVAAGTDESGSTKDPMDNPNFRRWFGRSKVVDKDGNPLVVYHGTQNNFTVFDKNRSGGMFFFASDKKHAEYYKGGYYGSVGEYYIKSENILDLTQINYKDKDKMKVLLDYINEYDEWIDRYSGEESNPLDLIESGYLYDYEGTGSGNRWRYLFKFAKNHGYDGVKIFDATDGVSDVTYVVFDPGQIKSVDNAGTFDPDNPDIRKEKDIMQDELKKSIKSILSQRVKGGPGSGHHDHAGRPGKVGGSRSEGEAKPSGDKEPSGEDKKPAHDSGDGDEKRYSPYTGNEVKKFNRDEWDKIDMGKRRSSWDDLPEYERDDMAAAETSISKRIKEITGSKRPPKSGDVQKDIENRVNQLKSEISSDSVTSILDTAQEFDFILEKLGIDAGKRYDMAMEVTDTLIAQEHEATRRTLGDHGINHIRGNIEKSIQILEVVPGADRAEDLAAIYIASIYHDTGYLTEPSRSFLDEGHPRWSRQHYDANIAPMVRDMFGEYGNRISGQVSHIISTHASSDVDWTSDVVASAYRVADNTALFRDEKLPALFRLVPDNVGVLESVQSKKIDIGSAKTKMMANIKGSDLSDSIKSALVDAVNEMAPITGKLTLGMLGGRIDGFEWKNNALRIYLSANKEATRLQKLFDLGQRQFAKFAESYGVDPSKFLKDLSFQFFGRGNEENGSLLLEAVVKGETGSIKKSLKDNMLALLIRNRGYHET